MSEMTFKELAGKRLSKFSIEERTEVYKTDLDGRKTKSLGFFKDPRVAKAFASNQVDAAWHGTDQAFLLTDGISAYLIGEKVELVDDEKERLAAQEAAKKKLSPEERKLLGFE